MHYNLTNRVLKIRYLSWYSKINTRFLKFDWFYFTWCSLQLVCTDDWFTKGDNMGDPLYGGILWCVSCDHTQCTGVRVVSHGLVWRIACVCTQLTTTECAVEWTGGENDENCQQLRLPQLSNQVSRLDIPSYNYMLNNGCGLIMWSMMKIGIAGWWCHRISRD